MIYMIVFTVLNIFDGQWLAIDDGFPVATSTWREKSAAFGCLTAVALYTVLLMKHERYQNQYAWQRHRTQRYFASRYWNGDNWLDVIHLFVFMPLSIIFLALLYYGSISGNYCLLESPFRFFSPDACYSVQHFVSEWVLVPALMLGWFKVLYYFHGFDSTGFLVRWLSPSHLFADVSCL